MSDRLINAEKLFNSRPEWLNENMEDKEKSAYNKGWNACNNEWCNMVKEQPAVEIPSVDYPCLTCIHHCKNNLNYQPKVVKLKGGSR